MKSAINTANAKDLKLAWEQSLNHDEAQECTPIIAEGTIFVTTASGPKYVHAFDAKTGTPKWRIEFQIAPDVARFACCGIVNRGASYSNGKLFVGRLDGKLTCHAADAKGVVRKSSGYYGQAAYTFGTTKLGLNYGVSTIDQTKNDAATSLKQHQRITAGLYHPIADPLNLVVELTNMQAKNHAGGTITNNAFNVGVFLEF